MLIGQATAAGCCNVFGTYTIFTNSYINKVNVTKGFTFPLWKLPFHSEKSHYMIKNGQITIIPRVFHFGTVYITEYAPKYLVFNASMGTVAIIKLFLIAYQYYKRRAWTCLQWHQLFWPNWVLHWRIPMWTLSRWLCNWLSV